MNCGELTKDLIAASCGQTAVAGLEDDVILINYNDIDKTASTVTNNVISSLLLKGSKKGFKFSTFGRSLDESGITFTKGTYRNTWAHDLYLRIFTKDEDAKKYVNEFGDGAKVVAIVRNNEIGKDGDVAYEVYGWDNGLELKESTSTVAMQDGVVYMLHIGSSDTAQEGSIPKSVFATDLETTEQMVNALTA
jgi:hypothetical protein